ncbi:MAG: GH25 family lysozyme [Dehalococcoidia bacterium]
MPLAIDVSNYTGPIDLAHARALVAAGVRRVVVGTQYPPAPFPPGAAHRQIPALLDVGIEVHAYVYLWLASDTAAQVRDAAARIAPWEGHLGALWLDVEDTTAEALTPAQRLQALRAAIEAARTVAPGRPLGIYTARWYWHQAMADTDACAALPLWAAQYDGRRDLEFAPFGGWRAAAMKQYAGDTEIAGLENVDLNWYEAAPRPLTEAELGYAFAALYRGLAPQHLPVDVRWGAASRDADGTEVHPLLVRGRAQD